MVAHRATRRRIPVTFLPGSVVRRDRARHTGSPITDAAILLSVPDAQKRKKNVEHLVARRCSTYPFVPEYSFYFGMLANAPKAGRGLQLCRTTPKAAFSSCLPATGPKLRFQRNITPTQPQFLPIS